MTTRNIYFFDMKVTARGKLNRRDDPIDFNVKPKDISTIAEDIKQIFTGGDNLLQSGRNTDSPLHYLQDCQVDDEKIVLLVNRCDPKAPDMVTSNPAEKEQIVHAKPAGHGGDFSSHVVIMKKPVRGDNYYLCVIESLVGSGLNSTVIKSYLKSVLNKCRFEFKDRYTISDISEPKVKVRHVHDIAFQGHPSESFMRDLENGYLSGAQAINYTGVGKHLDSNGAITEDYKTIKLKVDSSLIGDTLASLKAVRSKLMSEYKEYSELRIAFRTDGENKSAKLSIETGQLVDADRYTKKHELKSIVTNRTSYAKISSVILKEIMSYIGK